MASDVEMPDVSLQQLFKWLEDNGLSQFKENFQNHKVNTLERLVLIKTEEKLSRMGIDSFGDQLQILDCISNYRCGLTASSPQAQKRKIQKQTTLPFAKSQPKVSRLEEERKPYGAYLYKNPKWPKTQFFHERTPKLYESYAKFLHKNQQELFIRKERQARWERLQALKKLNDKFDAIFNPEYTGGYHKFPQKPSLPRQSHVDHCQQGIKETHRISYPILTRRKKTHKYFWENVMFLFSQRSTWMNKLNNTKIIYLS